MSDSRPLSTRTIALFWLPLWATWMMMAAEGPFVAAIIARLADPTPNLAAYGVAYSLALIVEGPVIMMMSASTALVRDARSLHLLRTFTFRICAAITALMLVLLAPPVFDVVARSVLALPADIAARTHFAVALFLPWPAAIGYRRFYQGVLIRHHLTRRVAYGTVVRLTTMAVTASALFAWGGWDGASVGAAALAAGVLAEAAASRVMVAPVLRDLARRPDRPDTADLSFVSITRFYMPLALTSMLTMGVQPIVTFLVARSRMAVESLAIMPVVLGLVFLFRTFGLAFQEVAIALAGEHHENFPALRRFATALGCVAAGGVAVIAFTPLAPLWYGRVAALAPELARFALTPTRALAILPALTVLLSFQRAMLVNYKATRFITWATAAEVGGVAVSLAVAVLVLDLPGAVAAAGALVLGRLAANASLVRPLRRLAARHP